MVTHFYDSSPDSPEVQHIRLNPARAITDVQIPCMVWAEDALSFVHFVPTVLFGLQLLVPDEELDAAASAVTSSLPYMRRKDSPESWLEHRFIDNTRPVCFPNSIYLKLTSRRSEDDPEAIYLHPQSYFSVDARDHDRSVALSPPLPSVNAQIRFPTRTTLFDALIDTILDPPIGYRHWKLTQTLEVYLGYLITYTLREYPRILPGGELEPEHDTVLKSLKPENRQFFYRRVTDTSQGWISEVADRRAFLRRAGLITSERGRPLPRNIPFLPIKQLHTRTRDLSQYYHSTLRISKPHVLPPPPFPKMVFPILRRLARMLT